MRQRELPSGIWLTALIFLLATSIVVAAQGVSRATDQALSAAVRGTSAIAVVLDVKSGQLLAIAHPQEAAELRSSPGSVLKPFFLIEALEAGRIRPETTVLCRRSLRIAGRKIDCTHPASEAVFDAEQALAYSCNSYFAELAKRFPPKEASAALQKYGLAEQSEVLSSPVSGVLQQTGPAEATELFVLGLDGIEITPRQLASAYRKLALQLPNLPSGSAAGAVERGLEGSVQYGMAHNAETPGVSISGKTGTASNTGQPWTHGWFAGYAPSNTPKVVIVVYLPRGNGADAAHLAQGFFNSYKETLLR
jgi:cell division protein FtsI/penicillin-binding protein 2